MKGCATSKNGTGLLLTSTSIASTSQRWELGRWSGCWLMIRVMQSLTFKTLVSSLDIHKGWRKGWWWRVHWSKWSWWWWRTHWPLRPYQDGKFFLHLMFTKNDIEDEKVELTLRLADQSCFIHLWCVLNNDDIEDDRKGPLNHHCHVMSWQWYITRPF